MNENGAWGRESGSGDWSFRNWKDRKGEKRRGIRNDRLKEARGLRQGGNSGFIVLGSECGTSGVVACNGSCLG